MSIIKKYDGLGSFFCRELNNEISNKDVNKKKLIDQKIGDYINIIRNITETVTREMEALKEIVQGLKPEILGQLLINLRYLVKHIAFNLKSAVEPRR